MRAPTIITTTQNIPNARTMILGCAAKHPIFFTDKRSPKEHDIKKCTHHHPHLWCKKLQRSTQHRSSMNIHNWIDGEASVSTDSKTMAAIPPGTPIQDDSIRLQWTPHEELFVFYSFLPPILNCLTITMDISVLSGRIKREHGAWADSYPSTTLLVQVSNHRRSSFLCLPLLNRRAIYGTGTCIADAVATLCFVSLPCFS